MSVFQVLAIYLYLDLEDLMSSVKRKVIDPEEGKIKELKRRNEHD